MPAYFKSHLQKGYGVIAIIIAVAVMAVIIAGYFLFFYPTCERVANDLVICQSYFQKLFQQEPKERQPAQNVNPDSPVDTSNWKTYRNEKYGFEVRYPPNYEVRDSTAENKKYYTTLQFLIEFCDRTSTGCNSSVQIYNGVFREPSVGERTYVNKLKRNGFTYWLGGEKDILSTFKFFR